MAADTSGSPSGSLVRDIRGRFVAGFRAADPALAAAQTVLVFIQDRTDQGLDRSGRRFRGYTDATVQKKLREGKPAGVVNLRHSGRMRESWEAKPEAAPGLNALAASVRFGPRREQQKLRFHITGTKYMDSRDPVGVTPRENDAIGRRFNAAVERVVPRDRRRTITVNLLQL